MQTSTHGLDPVTDSTKRGAGVEVSPTHTVVRDPNHKTLILLPDIEMNRARPGVLADVR